MTVNGTITDTSIPVKATYTLDTNENNTCTIQYRTSPSGTWNTITATVDRATKSWTATATGLASGTSYDFLATFDDTDGVNTPNPIQLLNVSTTDNRTAVGALTVTSSTDTSISVQSAFSYDSNGNNTCTIEYRTNPSGSWNTLTATRGAGVFTATASGLTPGTGYDFQATFTDADGLSGTNPATLTNAQTTNNGTATGTVTATTVTDDSISVQATYARDTNDNNTCQIQYRTNPSGSWNTITATVDRANKWYTATASGLNPGTAYDFQATFSDGDGLTGTNPVQLINTSTTSNGTTAGALTATAATDTSISVSAAFTRDPNASNSCVIEYRTNPSGTWNAITATRGASAYTATATGLNPGTGYDFRATFTDADGIVGTNPATLTASTTGGNPPTSAITAPTEGENLTGVSYTVTGTAVDNNGSGLNRVEVSTNGGSTWKTATGTTSWSYNWVLPVKGSWNVKSRAVDNLSATETPGAGVDVTVTAYGSPELQHYNWNPASSGSCSNCHGPTGTFVPAGFNKAFCSSCHNGSGVAHDRDLYGHSHSILVNVTSGGNRMPTYGNNTSGENCNKMVSKLNSSNQLLCTTCHNIMSKTEDYGRVWELTTTSDYQTYTLQRGGWDIYGNMPPKVYRDTTLWSGNGPTYSQTKKKYLVDPSEYAYDSASGTITFSAQQPVGTYIYATLDYAYLRVSSQDNNMCSDCHSQVTHKGSNCLNCHQTHNTGNQSGIKENLRALDQTDQPVKFLRYTGANSFADGDATHDGVCEVCHTTTKYYRRDGGLFANHSGGVNYDRANCTQCHSHSTGFAR